MNRRLYISSPFVLAALLGLGQMIGCGTSDDESMPDNTAALVACHLKDGTVGRDAELRACDPQNTKKTTICHIPPGNPANAHTLCIGNAAVPAHLDNHGDYLGACVQETPCPPPGGSGGVTGTGGHDSEAGGAAGSVVIVP